MSRSAGAAGRCSGRRRWARVVRQASNTERQSADHCLRRPGTTPWRSSCTAPSSIRGPARVTVGSGCPRPAPRHVGRALVGARFCPSSTVRSDASPGIVRLKSSMASNSYHVLLGCSLSSYQQSCASAAPPDLQRTPRPSVPGTPQEAPHFGSATRNQQCVGPHTPCGSGLRAPPHTWWT